MNEENYKRDLVDLFIYYTLVICLFISMRFFSEEYTRDLFGANLVLSIIMFPCSILNYAKKRFNGIYHNSSYICILYYSSTLIESIFRWNFGEDGVQNGRMMLLVIYRIFLMQLMVSHSSNFVKKICKYRTITFYTSMLISIILVNMNNQITINREMSSNFTLLFNLVGLLSYIIVIKLAIMAYKMRDFFLTAYVLQLGILSIRFFSENIFKFLQIEKYYEQINAVLFFLAYSLMLVAVFVEIKRILISNIELNTDVKNMSHDFNQIKETEKLRSNFMANLSHEFRTPINILFSCIQLLKEKKSVGNEELLESYFKFEPVIEQNCYRMIRLVNNFIDINKIKGGFMNLNLKNHNIVELVENITMSVVPYTDNKNIQLIFDTSEEEIIIQCDSDSIERIMLNLLSNSIKFLNENGHILVNISVDDEYVIISVIDDGPGINEDIRKNIFEIFVQEDKTLSRSNEGSGIGLSLVQSLVDLHGGMVYISDNTCFESGTEIIVKLPNKKSEDDESDYKKINITDNSNIIKKINIEFSDIYNFK